MAKTPPKKKTASAEIDTLQRCINDADAVFQQGSYRNSLDLLAQAKEIVAKNVKLSSRLNSIFQREGKILNNLKQYDEAITVLNKASIDAEKNLTKGELAELNSSFGYAYMRTEKYDDALRHMEIARQLFFEANDVPPEWVIDQDGRMGKIYNIFGELDKAEEHLRFAVELATNLRAPNKYFNWSLELANVFVKQWKFEQAEEILEELFQFSLQLNDNAKLQLADVIINCTKFTKRYPKSGILLFQLSREVQDADDKANLVLAGLSQLEWWGAWNQIIKWSQNTKNILTRAGSKQELIDDIDEYKRKAEDFKKSIAKAEDKTAKGKFLDAVIWTTFNQLLEQNRINDMKDIAHLSCDIVLGLMNNTPGAWQPLISETIFFPFVTIEEMMVRLTKNGRVEESFELAQRLKSIGFCGPNMERIFETKTKDTVIKNIAAKHGELKNAIDLLKGNSLALGYWNVTHVRNAVAEYFAALEKLRDPDPVTYAKLGGYIMLPELIDVLPADSPVAILDINVTNEGTVLHIIYRNLDGVQIKGLFSEFFKKRDALRLAQVWRENNMNTRSPGKEQSEILNAVCRELHNKLICSLAQTLSKWGITQLILIPDANTKELPFHLSHVCGKEIAIRKEPSNFLGGNFPIEYATCIQAIAVSKYLRRPSQIRSILSVADPHADLAGARGNSNWLKEQSFGKSNFLEFTGAQATYTNLKNSIEQHDIVVLGTHGKFDNEDLTSSHLVLNEKNWTLADILDSPAFSNHPVFILSACEAGAAATGYAVSSNGIPNALISAGAACVIASLWPVEDVSMGLLLERFITHLRNPGFRPAAAIFRAFEDMRKIPKAEVLARFDALLRSMEIDGTADSQQLSYLFTQKLADQIDESENEFPFADFNYWGSIIVFGCGWSAPAGASVGGGVDMLALKYVIAAGEIGAWIVNGDYNNAINSLKEFLKTADGIMRARQLEQMALATWKQQSQLFPLTAKWKALKLLQEARKLAKAENSDELILIINETEKLINL